MNSMNKSIRGLLIFMALMTLLVLVGCRAFAPEASRVNKAPETFIIGAPAEHAGGYYHFHLYWLGTDADGRVEKFVWALTDTTIQIDITTDDEEDARFNPAINAATLEIGHWTTRTDSIFDFAIHQGTMPSYDMTFHIVAQDDFGDYDRTPARLHFFSNTLGSPALQFYRVDGEDWTEIGSDNFDVVGFGRPYTLAWAGSTPNIRGYDLDALAEIDTVPPFDDGLLGYKWQLNGTLGGNCNPSIYDCWSPRILNEATGDSVSFFGTATQLEFTNDDVGSGPFHDKLESGSYSIQVNSIDVAGVEIADYMRTFELQVNFDPDTRILDGEVDWAHPDASDAAQVYPYYILLKDLEAGIEPDKHAFSSGDTVPDRCYVVVKALGRDDLRDVIQDQTFKMGMTGFVQGNINSIDGGSFSYATTASPVNFDVPVEWEAIPIGDDPGWTADTLGFMVSPRTDFVFNMQSEDEHGRRDSSPAQLEFTTGRAPCLQCIELLYPDDPSAFDSSLDCYEPGDVGHPCMDGAVRNMAVTYLAAEDQADRMYLKNVTDFAVGYAVDSTTYEVRIVDNPVAEDLPNQRIESALRFRFKVLIHGRDNLDEQWLNPMYRILGAQFQVDYANDPNNRIVDGGGPDLIKAPLGGVNASFPLQTATNWTQVSANSANVQLINPQTGTWELRIDVAAPTLLFTMGLNNYKTQYLAAMYGENADYVFEQMMAQYGDGSVRAIVLDQASNASLDFPRPRPVSFRYFRGVRPPVPLSFNNVTWRHETLDVSGDTTLELFNMAMESGPTSDGSDIPTQHFNILLHGAASGGWTYP
jgi:hypothetical protein